MKTIKVFSGFISPSWGLIVFFSLSVTGCYTVLKNSSDYYTEFDTSGGKKEITQDTVIIQNEYGSEDYAETEYSDTSNYSEDLTEETSGDRTVIINRYYNDPWGWNYYNPNYPYSGWSLGIGWGIYYYDPYWYNPYWHSGYYWGYYPAYHYYPWYHHNHHWTGDWNGYSHYNRRDYGMRRYQLNPVSPGGSGVFMGGGSRMTTTGAVEVSGGQGRTYRDPDESRAGTREEGSRIEKSGKGNQRKFRSNDKIKSGSTKTKVKSGGSEGRKFRDNDNQRKDKDNSSRGTRTERNSNSGSGSQGRDANSGSSSRGGRDFNSGSSGGNNGGSRGGSGGSRDYNRPARK